MGGAGAWRCRARCRGSRSPGRRGSSGTRRAALSTQVHHAQASPERRGKRGEPGVEPPIPSSAPPNAARSWTMKSTMRQSAYRQRSSAVIPEEVGVLREQVTGGGQEHQEPAGERQRPGDDEQERTARRHRAARAAPRRRRRPPAPGDAPTPSSYAPRMLWPEEYEGLRDEARSMAATIAELYGVEAIAGDAAVGRPGRPPRRATGGAGRARTGVARRPRRDHRRRPVPGVRRRGHERDLPALPRRGDDHGQPPDERRRQRRAGRRTSACGSSRSTTGWRPSTRSPPGATTAWPSPAPSSTARTARSSSAASRPAATTRR